MPTITPATKPVTEAHPNAASANALWKAFVDAHKITGWKPSDDGSCALRLSGTRVVVLCLDDDPLLVAQVHIGPMPKEASQRGAYSEALLVEALGVIEGDTLGIDLAEDAAVYQRTLDLRGLDAKGLSDELWDMLDAVTYLRQSLPRTTA